MGDPPTFASVTSTPCTCGVLEQHAAMAGSPIVFDPQTAEYHITFGQSDAQGTLVIYHCPFCGGAAPKSKRHLLFAVIPPEEEARLATLLQPIKTIRDALTRLGEPDLDDPSGLRVAQDERDGQPPVRWHRRTLFYERLSDVADVHLTEGAGGRVDWRLIGKYVSGDQPQLRPPQPS